MWVFVGWLLIAIGLATVFLAIYFRSRALAQNEWNRVCGAVIRARVQFDGEYFDPVIEYRYELRGRPYVGNKVRSLMISVNWCGPSQSSVESYPVGMPVVVFVNPNDPFDSVLEPGGDEKFFPFIVTIASVLLLVGVWLLASGS